MTNGSAINIAITSPLRSMKSERELWEAYGNAKNEATITGLIRHYHGLVVSLARARLKCLPNSVPLSDLVAAGMVGLHDAIGKFKESEKVPFKSYASIRIRGAILDWLRLASPTPRAMAGQKIDYVEISKFNDTLVDPRCSIKNIEDRDEVQALLARLHKEERRVLQLHFFDGFRQTEVGAVYGISESGACLRIKAALAKVRGFVGI